MMLRDGVSDLFDVLAVQSKNTETPIPDDFVDAPAINAALRSLVTGLRADRQLEWQNAPRYESHRAKWDRLSATVISDADLNRWRSARLKRLTNPPDSRGRQSGQHEHPFS
jgi:hypothetical protein